MDSTSQMKSTKLNNYGLIPTDEKYFTSIDNTDCTVTLTRYTGTDLILVIPRTINEKLVTKIAPNFHYAYLTGNVKLNSEIIPYSNLGDCLNTQYFKLSLYYKDTVSICKADTIDF